MARTVKEIMNPELFSLRPSDDANEAVDYILALGITAAPVLDEERKPLGVVSLRDLLRRSAANTVAERMTVPAVTIGENERIETAARRLVDHGVHRVVVVDIEGHAVGVASTIDFVRALLGVPSVHPEAFPHWDKHLRVSWSDDRLLELDCVQAAPDGPGVLALVSGGPNVPERVVWGEAAANVRTRLYQLLSAPSEEAPELQRILTHYRALRFRTAATTSVAERERVAESLMADAHAALVPRHASP